MGIPNKRISINAYHRGRGWLGEVSAFVAPKLTQKTIEHYAGGMPGPIDVPIGIEKLEAEITMASQTARMIRQFGNTNLEGERIRLVESFRRQDGSLPTVVEHYCAGILREYDPGTAKPGDDTEQKYMYSLVHYSMVQNNELIIQVDMQSGIFFTGGVDRYAEIMAGLLG